MANWTHRDAYESRFVDHYDNGLVTVGIITSDGLELRSGPLPERQVNVMKWLEGSDSLTD